MKTTLFIPALNEYEGLRHFLPKIPRERFCQILVVDGQSTDESVRWLQESGYEFYVQKNRGIRNAYVEAWPLIKGDYVVTFSPDGNCKIEDLPLLLLELEKGADMVIASRYLPPAKSEDDNLLTAFGNMMFTKMISTLFRFKFTDSLTIYRGYRTDLFNTLDIKNGRVDYLEKILKTNVGVEPLISIRAAKNKLKIKEVSSDEPKRFFGSPKMLPFKWGLLILVQIMTEFIVPS